jgi:hypothetical protein
MRTKLRTRLRSKVTLLFLTCAVLLAIPAIALADNVSNTIDTSVDAVAENMPLNQGGPNGTTKLYIDPTNGDGKNGCNLTSSTTLIVALSSDNTSVATVSPSQVTFTSCLTSANGIPITVTPHNAGTANISASLVSENADGTFNLAPAAFKVTVAPPPNTPPQVTISGVTGGANYNKGSVPNATCNVTDAEDGNSSFAATLSAITGPYASDGIGSQTASCSYTDNGPGTPFTAESSLSYSIVDPSAPVIGYTLDPANADGSNGWYKSDVTLTWNVSEPQSPSSLQKTGCVDQSITTDQAATTYTCSATSAGGSADEQSVTIKRDATAPDVTLGGVSGTSGTNDWYKSVVTQTFNATDATSGLAGPASFTKSSGANEEGSNVSISSGAVLDNAGNSSSNSAGPFKIDLSDPTNVQFSGGPAAGGEYFFGNTPDAPTCTADDAVSGLKDCVVTGYSTAVGTHTMTATATDNAGRTATETRSYTVKAWTTKGFYQPVDMGGVFNTVKGGSTVPLKFELFSGTTELTSTSAVTSLQSQKVSCTSGSEDAIEELAATGGTSLRYDTTGGQFIYNWKTPTGAGCYKVTMTAQDGSTISAYFKTK